MSLDKTAFLDFLTGTGALRFGDYTLKSGDRSPFFVNLGDVATARDLHLLGSYLALGLREHFPETTALFGPAYKGIVLASATALASWSTWQWDLPVSYNRKERKAHGEGSSRVGRAPQPGGRIVIVDDVFSSSGTKI